MTYLECLSFFLSSIHLTTTCFNNTYQARFILFDSMQAKVLTVLSDRGTDIKSIYRQLKRIVSVRSTS